ncbi:blue copper domain protein [Natrinema gari JCM 14663]|uniref:Blue copper domain protein n=1 Tax=Natrinema gari JCM 14663 TaxID=1230459 RepID=L9ZA50_9EURY|nr:blue copper domain protein [Natrinema gari JCM 14663]
MPPGESDSLSSPDTDDGGAATADDQADENASTDE